VPVAERIVMTSAVCASRSAVTEGFRTPREIIAEYPSIDDFLTGRSQKSTIAGGFALDDWTHYFRPVQLIIIAARPSMGKTAWAVMCAACGNDTTAMDLEGRR